MVPHLRHRAVTAPLIRLRTLGAVALTGPSGESLDGIVVQSKRFALLVYLALALPRGWHRRDTLLALFWPDLDQARARHALRQALHFLRRRLGEGVVHTRGAEDVALGPALWCDAVAFEDGDPSAATLALYTGELLPGFFVRDAAPEWDHWVDQRRDALRSRAAGLSAHVVPSEDARPRPPVTPQRPRRWRWMGLAAAAVLFVALFGTWISPRRALARSALADSLYRRGVVTLEDRQDHRAALGWFEAALQASPRFPLAAYYAGVSADGVDGALAEQWFSRAAQLAPQASEHDRLVIQTALAFRHDDPAALAAADTLALRYPGDALAHHLYGATLLWSGRFGDALREFRRELDLTETLGADTLDRTCPSCQAREGVIVSLQFLDSLPAAERAAREEVRIAPRSGGAWGMLAVIAAAEGHAGDARSAGRHSSELVPGTPGDPLGAADMDIRDGAFTEADRKLRDALTYDTRARRERARWLLIISLRNQGRLLEALNVARAYRREGEEPSGADAVPVAQVLFEMGRSQEAALLYDSVAAPPAGGRAAASGVAARWQCWTLAHAAEAWAALGDTTRVAADADTIEHLALRSLYGRDRHLPAHLRGLMWLARGRPDRALTALDSAVFSLSIGYTRTNLALAKVLLAAGRPHDAATVAAAGLAEAVDGSAYYATRTELHELAARAFDAAGETDSAAAHYRAVVGAWAQSDPSLAPRLAFARERLAALTGAEHHGFD